jgi:serine/threonine-protein kinase
VEAVAGAEGEVEAAADLSLDRARAVNRCCERFEARWRAGQRPAISSFLDEVGALERPALLRELLALELELRRAQGESPSVGEYLRQFPDRQPLIADVFAQIEAESGSAAGSTADYTPAPRLDEAGPRLSEDATLPPTLTAGSPQDDRTAAIGEYELIEELARGGMGVVYKARHKGLKRLVALKMILSGSMATSEERERFRREAELAANLDHPNIVPIYEVDEHQARPFFSMKLVDGGSLARQVGRFRDDPHAIARLVSALARAVHYAHGQKFLHCDLKPSNVLLDTHGKPYLTDFGLARRTGVESSLSISGAILGTPSYMAPEQATGSRARLGPATDVYGLGAILYELLTGRPPFRAPTIMETVVQVLERDPAPPREVRPDVPRQLEGICLKCLEKAPKDRYPSAEALADELDNYLRGDGIDAAGVVSRLRRWNRREPELVARLGGLLVVALLTQYNYVFLTPDPNARIHYLIQAVLGLWAGSSALFQLLLRRGWQSDRVRVLWSASDILFLTLELKMLCRVETTLLVGYPLLIAASGLWWRVHLVWITTAMAMAAYGVLYLDAALRWRGGQLSWTPRAALQYPNIFLAALFLTGYVVVRQVKRILALGRYYEHRPGT